MKTPDRGRLFAVVAVLVLAAAAFATVAAVESEDVDAATLGSESSPVSSVSIDYSDGYKDVYAYVGSSVKITTKNWTPKDGTGIDVPANCGLTGDDSTLTVTGTLTKAGTFDLIWYINYEYEQGEIFIHAVEDSTTPVTSISLNYTSRSVTVGGTTTVTATTSPTSADDRHVTWKITSGSSYISISSSDTSTGGKVTITGVKAGTAKIQAVAADGSGVTSSTCTITVSDPSYTSTLKYNANGGSGAPSTQTYTGTSTSSHTFTISSTVPTRDGYDFLGWATSSSATSASYQPGGTISVGYNSTTTLYAVWQAVYTSTLEYDANGGTGAPDAQTYTSSSTSDHTFTISSTVPTREGYDFLGWALSSSAEEADYQPGDAIAVAYDGTVTLYAVWSIKVYTVTFWSDGQIYAQWTLDYGSELSPPDDPEMSGMFFTGWYSDEDCTQAYDFLSPVASDVDLYAGWVEELAFETIPTIDVVIIATEDGTLCADASASTDWQRIAWYVDGCLACYGECVTLSLPSGTHYVTAVASNTAGASLWGDYVEVPDEDEDGVPWLLVAAGVAIVLILIVALWRHLLIAGLIAAVLAVLALWYLL